MQYKMEGTKNGLHTGDHHVCNEIISDLRAWLYMQETFIRKVC